LLFSHRIIELTFVKVNNFLQRHKVRAETEELSKAEDRRCKERGKLVISRDLLTEKQSRGSGPPVPLGVWQGDDKGV